MPYDKKTDQYVIKKSSFFRNTSFSHKKCAPMQRFINQMSKNGLHLVRISKFKCVFAENAAQRYVYALCGEGGQTLYTQSPDWEHFLTFKHVMFFRKLIPADAVRIERKFKSNQKSLERNWLTARLAEGLYLIARVENEYIFAHSNEYTTYEYHVKRIEPSNRKEDLDKTDTLKDTKGLIFVAASSDCQTYYFLKDARFKHLAHENRGKRLSDQILAAFLAVLSVVGFGAFAALCIFGVVKSTSWIAVLGGFGMFVAFVCFVAFFRRTQNIAELRTILKQERLAKEKSEQPEQPQKEEKPSDPTQSNTVVMNTVVVNKYGDEEQKKKRSAKSYDQGLDSIGQIFDSADNPALDPNLNPAIAASKDPIRLANAFSDTEVIEQECERVYRDDTIYDGAFSQGSSTIAPVTDITNEIRDENDQDEQVQDDQDYTSDSAFKTYLPYIISVLGGIALGALGLFWLISFFSTSNALTLVAAVISLIFSPFLVRFGIANCKEISYENSDLYQDEDDQDQ